MVELLDNGGRSARAPENVLPPALRLSFLAFMLDAPGVQAFGDERDGDGGNADETPFLVGVFDDFPDDKRREDSRCADPMPDFAWRRVGRRPAILASDLDCVLRLFFCLLHSRIGLDGKAVAVKLPLRGVNLGSRMVCAAIAYSR